MAWTGGTTVVRRRQPFLSLEREVVFEKGAIQGRAAYAVTARICLPHAARGDVGAVHHDTSLDARPLVDGIVVFLWSVSRRWQP
jgi:hypothetical protein